MSDPINRSRFFVNVEWFQTGSSHGQSRSQRMVRWYSRLRRYIAEHPFLTRICSSHLILPVNTMNTIMIFIIRARRCFSTAC